MEAPARTIQFEDAVLVRRIQAGDLQSFAHLVCKYQDKVYNTCCRLCGNAEDAHDVTQEAFLKALDSIASFRARSSFYTWLFRIAVNQALSQRRRVFRAPTHSLDDPGPDGMPLSQRLRDRRAHDPAGQMGAAEVRLRVGEALAALDDDQRAAVVLRDIEGFDYAEIAEILDTPTGTVKSRIARGREALRRALTPLIEGQGQEDGGDYAQPRQPG